MKFDKFSFSFSLSSFYIFIALLFLSDIIFCGKLKQAPPEKPINLKVIPSRMNKLSLDDLDQIKMEVLHDMNSQLKDLEDEMADKQRLKEKTSSSWSITGAPIYLPRDPNEPGKFIPTKSKTFKTSSPAREEFSRDMNKMLSFKELEKQLLEADEVLSELKQLKAEKEKNKNELLNHKFKEKSDKNTKQDNKNLSKDKNKLQEKEKEKLKTDKQIMQKNSNSTINEINQQNPNKDSNSTRSNDVERIDVKKKISETLEPFENEIKKLLNMNSFGGDVTLKVNKTSDSVEIEKDEKNEKSNSVEKNEKPESEKNSKNSENPDLTENIADTIMSAMKISESNKENAHKEDDIKENSSDNITDKTSENSSEDEDKQISQKEESTEMNNNKIKSNSISKIPDKTRENMKSVKELNEELKLDNKEFKNNFLKDIMIKPENPNEKMKEANDSSFSAIPKTPSINKNNREPRYNKKITNIDLNKSKQEKAKNNSGANSNFSLLEKNSLGSSQRNTSPTTKYFNLNNSANLGDDGTFKLPDGPILDFPFFGMI